MRNSAVNLEIPAASAYLVLCRTAVAAMCARLDYPIDRLEDTKLAVDEAATLLLADTDPSETIRIRLTPGVRGHLMIELRARTIHGRAPRQTSFAWTVLSALVDEVLASAENGKVKIILHASNGRALVGS